MHDTPGIVVGVRELLRKDPFPPRVVQTLLAAAALATHCPVFPRQPGGARRAVTTPDLRGISECCHQIDSGLDHSMAFLLGMRTVVEGVCQPACDPAILIGWRIHYF